MDNNNRNQEIDNVEFADENEFVDDNNFNDNNRR